MALLLNIDTATSFASVGFSRDGILLDIISNDSQKEHASFLQPAISTLAWNLDIALHEIDAVALTIGPGSYTGLRVGLSGAKGLAYALGKPIIPVVTLEVMAHAAKKEWSLHASEKNGMRAGTPTQTLFCPMIDARRSEVFMAIYGPGGKVVMEPRALVLDAEIFDVYEKNNLLIFSGDGHIKWEPLYSRSNARFLKVQHTAGDLAALAEKRFNAGEFGSLAYLEPLYLKEFHKNS